MEICERFAGKHIVKRNGSVKSFDVTKIVSAVTRAGKATGEFGEAKALDLVCAYVLPRLDEKSTLCIELVQAAVEHAPVVDEHLREEKIVLHRAPKLLRRRRLLGGVEQHGELPVRL